MREASPHSVEQETLGYRKKDRIWEIGAHVNKVQGLRRSEKDIVAATLHGHNGVWLQLDDRNITYTLGQTVDLMSRETVVSFLKQIHDSTLFVRANNLIVPKGKSCFLSRDAIFP